MRFARLNSVPECLTLTSDGSLLLAGCSDGSLLTLSRRDREYVIHANGRSLMSSLMHGSEEALATIACRHARARADARVLVGGLGMGFTLRATLDALPADATLAPGGWLLAEAPRLFLGAWELPGRVRVESQNDRRHAPRPRRANQPAFISSTWRTGFKEQ